MSRKSLSSTEKQSKPRVLWPDDLQRRYNVSQPTRWRWERDGKIPRRDVFIGGKPEGWYESTIEASERNTEQRA